VPADELARHGAVQPHAGRLDEDGQRLGSGRDGKLKVAAGGARLVEQLGDKGAVVLLFARRRYRGGTRTWCATAPATTSTNISRT
jgi:hypothetical protein